MVLSSNKQSLTYALQEKTVQNISQYIQKSPKSVIGEGVVSLHYHSNAFAIVHNDKWKAS